MERQRPCSVSPAAWAVWLKKPQIRKSSDRQAKTCVVSPQQRIYPLLAEDISMRILSVSSLLLLTSIVAAGDWQQFRGGTAGKLEKVSHPLAAC